MTSKSFPFDTLDQANKVLAGCRQIDPNLRTGATTQDDFSEQLTQTQAIQSQIAKLELQLIELRHRRDKQLASIWETTKRVRAVVKGVYGDDSTEYQIIGGKRMSERKKAMRRASPAEALS